MKEQKILTNSGYGMEMMKGGMEWIHTKLLKYKWKYFMIDYTDFDSTVPAWLMRMVFSLLEQKIDFSKTRNKNGHTVDCDSIKKITDYFKNICL